MTRMRAAPVVALLVCGCHAHLGDGPSPLGAGDDAPVGVDSAAMNDAAAVDAASACFNGRRVYLNFDGDKLTKGPSDATTDHAVWLGVTTATVPKFHANSATRTQDIQTVIDLINDKLGTFPISVVTQRPASGPYVMVVFGGDRTIVGTQYNYAVNNLDCGDGVKSDVAWVSDTIPTLQKTADFAVGSIAYGIGLTGTHDPNDCMCGWANGCQQPNNSACTLGMAINADLKCNGQTNPQNEVAAFQQAFCQ
jgi:hypothetical protein